MRDNLRRSAIRDALTQTSPSHPKGDFARHLTTLAALIVTSWAARARSCHIATTVPWDQARMPRQTSFAR